jgi:23S rRNA pseudouridine1911/1915/1917 synthase
MTEVDPSPRSAVVQPAEAGVRLDVWLAARGELPSRAQAKRLVQRGLVTVDGRTAQKGGVVLEAGQTVEWRPVPEDTPAAVQPAEPPQTLRILYEDAYLLAIDKPAGLMAHPPDRVTVPTPSVAALALAHCGELPSIAGEDRPGIVHRLDKDTSGVMVVAKNDEAFHFLRSQFKARTTRKVYRAIVHGEPRFDSDWIERRIAVDPRAGDRMTVVAEGGRDASTYYEVVERFTGFADVRCLPRTGRTHQIRVHLASIGHSLVGDRLYRSRRAPDALPEGAPNPGRHCLHAEMLGIRHPRTHEELQLEAPMPDDMVKLLRWLQQNRPART